ncbi:MAG: hypothetical protein ABSF22_00140 [Bryobacteraceae bacterium]
MTSVTSGSAISLVSIAEPQVAIQGRLLSLEGKYAEASLDGETQLSRGSLVEFQDSSTQYLGEVESGWTEAGTNRIRVLIEHTVDMEKAAAIRRLWNTDNPL